MTLQAGKMYRPTDVVFDVVNDVVYVVEQFNHRVSKWNYTAGMYGFTLDAGEVTSVVVNNGGTGYSVGDPVIFSAPDLDIANPVTATGEVGAETGGIIDSITVTNPGNGYSTIPTIDATGSGGGDAVLTAVTSTPWGNNGDGTTGEGAPVTSTTDNALYRPTGIVYDPDHDHLYLTDTFHNRVRVIDATNGAFIDSVGQGGLDAEDFYRPAGIAINNADDRIVIADELNHRAMMYLTNTGIPHTPTKLDSPPLSFLGAHGVIFDVTTARFDVTDSLRGIITRYDSSGMFQNQFGTPGTTGTDLFYPGSGNGILNDLTSTIFADTRNNNLKTVSDDTIVATTGTISGTGDGQLYYPESTCSFNDGSANYVLAANTLNNRVEAYSNVDEALTFESNFGSP